MTISVLARTGHRNAARRFMQFILNIIPFKDEKYQIMYGIRGEKAYRIHIDHLSGYQGSYLSYRQCRIQSETEQISMGFY